MAVHHGGKVGSAAKKLASKSTSKSTKSKAGKTLANHKAKYHWFIQSIITDPSMSKKGFFIFEKLVL